MMRRRQPSPQPAPWLKGKRITMRPLREEDFEQWQEVRLANEEWLLKWEPLRPANSPDPVRDRSAFLVRCDARRRDRQAGSGFSFGVFVDGQFAGEMNLSSIHRGLIRMPTSGIGLTIAMPDTATRPKRWWRSCSSGSMS